MRVSVKTHLFPNNTLLTSHFPSTHTKIMFGTNHLIIGYINASFTINRRHTGSDPNALTVPYANHNNDFHSWSLLTSFDYCHSCRWALCKWFDFGLVLEKRCDCNLVKARVLSHHEIEVGVWARVQFALSLCQTICMDQREAQTFTGGPYYLNLILWMWKSSAFDFGFKTY